MGELGEVVISPRRDRRGRIFWFARFINVRDVQHLATKLDNLVLEGRKLFANIPRFQRQEGVKLTKKVHKYVSKIADTVGRMEGSMKQGWFDHRSFKEVIQGKALNVIQKVKVPMCYQPEEDEIQRYSKAFTGVLRDPSMASSIKKIFLDEGLFYIRVTSSGPKICILDDLMVDAVKNFI